MSALPIHAIHHGIIGGGGALCDGFFQPPSLIALTVEGVTCEGCKEVLAQDAEKRLLASASKGMTQAQFGQMLRDHGLEPYDMPEWAGWGK
jgi:hypothetical protein